MPMILAVLTEPDTAEPCLRGCAVAAQVHRDARIEALHVAATPESLILPSEEVMTTAWREEIEAREADKARRIEAVFRRWAAAAGEVGSRTRWREVAGVIRDEVASRGRSADLLVLVRPPAGEGHDVLHAAIFETERPFLLMPSDGAFAFGRRIAIAWKDSDTARRAIAAALPWLRRADEVWALTVGGDASAGGAGPEFLRAHAIAASLVPIAGGNDGVGALLLANAHALGADMMVMGAYRHSRIVEWVLGGATRNVLRAADLPVLMSH